MTYKSKLPNYWWLFNTIKAKSRVAELAVLRKHDMMYVRLAHRYIAPELTWAGLKDTTCVSMISGALKLVKRMEESRERESMLSCLIG